MSMSSTSRIEEVDGVPTPDLDAFLRVVKSKVRLLAVTTGVLCNLRALYCSRVARQSA